MGRMGPMGGTGETGGVGVMEEGESAPAGADTADGGEEISSPYNK